MNVFLDTEVLYTDPYFRGNVLGKFLELVSVRDIHVFISEIVLKELLEGIRFEISKNEIAVITSIKELNKRLNKQIEVPHFELTEEIHCVELFYKSLEENQVIKVLKPKEAFLTSVLEKAITKQEPFFTMTTDGKKLNSKKEFKDALIWMTYSDYISTHELSECFFITNNNSDFSTLVESGGDKRWKLHSKLSSECPQMKLYISFDQFLKSEEKRLGLVTTRLSRWFENDVIDEEFVLSILWQNYYDVVFRKVYEELKESNIGDDIFADPFEYVHKDLYDNNFELESVSEIQVIQEEFRCLVIGQCSGNALVDISVSNYKTRFEHAEEKHLGSRKADFWASFSFYIDHLKATTGFEINNVELDFD